MNITEKFSLFGLTFILYCLKLLAAPGFKVRVFLSLFSSFFFSMCMKDILNYFIFPAGFKPLYTGLSNERSRNALNACIRYNYSCHIMLLSGILNNYSVSANEARSAELAITNSYRTSASGIIFL